MRATYSASNGSACSTLLPPESRQTPRCLTAFEQLVGAYALSYFVFTDMIDPGFEVRFDAIPWSAKLNIIPGGLVLILAWHAPHSPATRLGFASLAVIWFYSACMAYFSIRMGNVKLHQQWIVRSYALTLAAVTLRIQLPLLENTLGLSFDEAYAIVAWFAWIPNLIVAEWFFNQAPVRSAK